MQYNYKNRMRKESTVDWDLLTVCVEPTDVRDKNGSDDDIERMNRAEMREHDILRCYYFKKQF